MAKEQYRQKSKENKWFIILINLSLLLFWSFGTFSIFYPKLVTRIDRQPQSLSRHFNKFISTDKGTDMFSVDNFTNWVICISRNFVTLVFTYHILPILPTWIWMWIVFLSTWAVKWNHMMPSYSYLFNWSLSSRTRWYIDLWRWRKHISVQCTCLILVSGCFPVTERMFDKHKNVPSNT